MAERQDGMISEEQLRGLGLSPGDLRGEVRGGVLIQVFPKVFALGAIGPCGAPGG